MILLLISAAYVIGYLVTIILLILFGKKYLGIDYDDGPKDYDDWSSNAEAYVAWCVAWPLVWVVCGIVMLSKGIMFGTKRLIEITEKNETNKNQKRN